MNGGQKLAFHFIIWCGYNERMWEAGSIQRNYISTWPVFLTILFFMFYKRMGTLEGEASIELNIDESRCVILVLIRDGTRGQPVGSLQRPLAFFFSHFPVFHPHKYILERKAAHSNVGEGFSFLFFFFFLRHSSHIHADRNFVERPVPLAIYGPLSSLPIRACRMAGQKGSLLALCSTALWVLQRYEPLDLEMISLEIKLHLMIRSLNGVKSNGKDLV